MSKALSRESYFYSIGTLLLSHFTFNKTYNMRHRILKWNNNVHVDMPASNIFLQSCFPSALPSHITLFFKYSLSVPNISSFRRYGINTHDIYNLGTRGSNFDIPASLTLHPVIETRTLQRLPSRSNFLEYLCKRNGYILNKQPRGKTTVY